MCEFLSRFVLSKHFLKKRLSLSIDRYNVNLTKNGDFEEVVTINNTININAYRNGILVLKTDTT